MKKIAWFGTHPVQYHSPMFVQMAQDDNIDLTVYYFSDFSVQGYQDKEFGIEIKWNVSLLEGYKSKILKNFINKEYGSFFSYMNFGIFNEIRKHKYDLVAVHGWSTFSHLLIFLSCILTATPYALRGDTNSFGEGDRKGIKQFIRKIFLKTIFTKASAIFYIGEQNKKFYKIFDVDKNNMYKMPFAVNNDYFFKYGNTLDIESERQLLNICDNEKIILFSGKLIAKKQADLLIEALSEISKDYVLFIVGDGEERDSLELLASKLNVNTRFLGFINQKDIPRYYWLADILIMPSNYEPWGLSINEAMNCDCAIIVSDKVGAKDDLIKDNGFIFKTGSVKDLQEKINILINNDNRLKLCKQKSQQIIQDYSYETDLNAIKEYFYIKDEK